MQDPTHTVSVRYSIPARRETAWNPTYDCQTDPFSVLDVSPPSGEPGWSSEGTRKGGRNDPRGVFGNGVTYAARGPVNGKTRAPCGFSLRAELHLESGPLEPYLMLSGVVIRLTARIPPDSSTCGEAIWW